MSDLKLTHKEWSDKLLEKIESIKRADWTPVVTVKKDGSVQTISDIHNSALDQVIKAIKELE